MLLTDSDLLSQFTSRSTVSVLFGVTPGNSCGKQATRLSSKVLLELSMAMGDLPKANWILVQVSWAEFACT